MKQSFVLPAGLLGRFAIVKLWPEIKTAEDECIARLKVAAAFLGLKCIEIHADGRLVGDASKSVSKTNVDFVLHLHYDTPKLYDAFSFVALWNPVRFYHEWGYARTSRNLVTHDDFVSCNSPVADDQVRRLIRNEATHLPPFFNLYHSVADIVHPPSLGDHKLFYAGINWEAISGGKSRHQEVLRRLDQTDLLRIYGPEIFQGVRVWAGYKSYVREVPFDGVSMIDEIARAGVALVLSSQAHKDSELMSNRLFESVAAGALVICDENPFAKNFFGNSLLYIDGRSSVEQLVADITEHLRWAAANPEQALAMISSAQTIFREKFALIRNVADLYLGLKDRQQALVLMQNPRGLHDLSVHINLLMPEYSEELLRTHLDSLRVQEYTNISARIVVDVSLSDVQRRNIDSLLMSSGVNVSLVELDYWRFGIRAELKGRRRTGEVLQELLNGAYDADAFMVVAPNERLCSNHVAVLVGALQRNPQLHCAATAAILESGDAPIHGIHELLDFGHVNRVGPPGYGRFIFRIATIPSDINIALPYLDGRPLAVLIGDAEIDQQLPATIVIDIQKEFPPREWDEAAETEVIRAYCPGVFKISVGFAPRPAACHSAAPALASPALARRFLNRRWLRAQIEAVRTQGLSARIQVFRKKAGL